METDARNYKVSKIRFFKVEALTLVMWISCVAWLWCIDLGAWLKLWAVIWAIVAVIYLLELCFKLSQEEREHYRERMDSILSDEDEMSDIGLLKQRRWRWLTVPVFRIGCALMARAKAVRSEFDNMSDDLIDAKFSDLRIKWTLVFVGLGCVFTLMVTCPSHEDFVSYASSQGLDVTQYDENPRKNEPLSMSMFDFTRTYVAKDKSHLIIGMHGHFYRVTHGLLFRILCSEPDKRTFQEKLKAIWSELDEAIIRNGK